MNSSRLRFLSPALVLAGALLALPTPAHAADGLHLLTQVAHLKAQAANEQAVEAANKQRDLVAQKKTVRDLQAQLEGAAPTPAEPAPPSAATQAVDALASVVDFESTAGADGLDEGERATLLERVEVAKQRVDAASAEATAAIASAKQLLAEAKSADEKQQIKLYVKSLRAAAKSHKQTAAALRAVSKKLAAPAA